RLGLVCDARWARFCAKRELLERGRAAFAARPALARAMLRQDARLDDVARELPEVLALPAPVRALLEVELRYAGYVERQALAVERQRLLEETALPDDLDYLGLGALRREAREKLQAVRPRTVGQAG